MSTSSDPSSGEEPAFGRVAVLGLGLMGGSIVRALTERAPRSSVIGWSPDEGERRAAHEAGAIDRAPDRWQEAVADADLVVLAVPPAATCSLLVDVGRHAPPESTLSDVASLKEPVARSARDAGLAGRWVGAHPMAGGEASGFGASRGDLFEGARVWLVSEDAASERARRVRLLWSRLGARPAQIGAEEHDRLMARASHLPQLAATVLASVLAEAGLSLDDLGTGGRDTTRLAASSPEMWRELLEHARPELVEGMRALSAGAREVADLLERGRLDELEELLRRAGSWRRG